MSNTADFDQPPKEALKHSKSTIPSVSSAARPKKSARTSAEHSSATQPPAPFLYQMPPFPTPPYGPAGFGYSPTPSGYPPTFPGLSYPQGLPYGQGSPYGQAPFVMPPQLDSRGPTPTTPSTLKQAKLPPTTMPSSDGPPEPPLSIYPHLRQWLHELQADSDRNPDQVEFGMYGDLLVQNGFMRICDLRDDSGGGFIQQVWELAKVPMGHARMISNAIEQDCKRAVKKWFRENST